LDAVPAEIGNLSNLKTLNANNNSLDMLPVEIGNLSNLTILDLSANQLVNIPSEVQNMINLQSLNLHHNSLRIDDSDLLTFLTEKGGSSTKEAIPATMKSAQRLQTCTP